jgi:hypothetical protein
MKIILKEDVIMEAERTFIAKIADELTIEILARKGELSPKERLDLERLIAICSGLTVMNNNPYILEEFKKKFIEE